MSLPVNGWGIIAGRRFSSLSRNLSLGVERFLGRRRRAGHPSSSQRRPGGKEPSCQPIKNLRRLQLQKERARNMRGQTCNEKTSFGIPNDVRDCPTATKTAPCWVFTYCVCRYHRASASVVATNNDGKPDLSSLAH